MDSAPEEPAWSFGPFVLDCARRTLTRDGEPVAITPKAFDILAVLAASAGHVVPKETIMQAVWPGTFVDDGNLAFQVSTLRKALDNVAPGDSRFIVTVPGRGYQLAAPVERVDDEIVIEQRSTTTLAIAEDEPRLSRQHWIGVVAATLSVIIAAIVVQRLRDKPAIASPPRIRALAVLPFKPLVAADRDEALELGMADTLIARISSFRGVTVRPLSAVRRYGGLEQDPIAAGRKLGVDAVLDGSIQDADNKVRVTVRLLRVADGAQLWSGQFDSPFANIFSLHDAISERVVEELSLNLTDPERVRLRTPETRSPEAYRAYLLGYLHYTRLRRDSMLKSIDFFQQAITLDPKYARAYASLAVTQSVFVLAAYSPPESSTAAVAKAAATQAIALDPTLAAAHASLGLEKVAFEWDWNGAEQACRRALELDRSDAWAHRVYALLLSNTGRHVEALRHAGEMLRLDPVDPMVNTQYGEYLRAAGRLDEALAAQKHTLEIAPGFWVADIHLGKVYEEKGMVADALTAYQVAYEHSGRSSEPLARAGHLLGKTGRAAEARQILSELEAMSRQIYVPPVNIAMVHIGLDEKNEALRWLGRACAGRDGNLPYIKVERFYDALRDHPGFVEIERCVNLP